MQTPHRNAATRTSPQPNRKGILMPAIIMALVVLLCCLALVLDSLWLDAADTELAAGADAAALAAARELATDDTLKADLEWKSRLQAAQTAALDVAAANRAAGTPIALNVNPQMIIGDNTNDIRFGRLVNLPTGHVRFLETEFAPTSVVVTAQRTRERGNPIALFFRGLTGQAAGDAAARVEATVDNRVIGVRPASDGIVPALPLAILSDDPTGARVDTWTVQIVNGTGADAFRYDAETDRVRPGPDGLPEIVLLSKSRRQDAAATNVNLIDIGTDLRTQALVEQINNGWTVRDLERWDGELVLSDRAVELTSASKIDRDVTVALREQIGLQRVIVLARQLVPGGPNGFGKVLVNGFAAGRIMSVTRLDDDVVAIVLQPTVLNTHTAVIVDESRWQAANEQQRKRLKNPYIYKLHLTH